MKLKKVVVSVSNKDIMNFMTIQNKISISDIRIENNIVVIGDFELLNNKVKFEAEFNIEKVENNNIYVNIKSFSIYKIKILNSISKKAFNYIIKVFTDIEGISFEDECFKIEVSKIIDKHYEEQMFLDINNVNITNIEILNGEIEIAFGGIKINTNAVKDEFSNGQVEYMEAEIVDIIN